MEFSLKTAIQIQIKYSFFSSAMCPSQSSIQIMMGKRTRVVEEDIIALDVKERVLLFTRNVLDLVKNDRK